MKKFEMKRITSILFLTLIFASSLLANNVQTIEPEDNKVPFSIKAYPFRGMYLDKGTHWDKFNDDKGPAHPAGVHLGFELPSTSISPILQSESGSHG